jgi:hypothetical protein
MAIYPPLVIGNATSLNPGGQQQMQAGQDQIDPQYVPGTNNGDRALAMVSKLIVNLAANGNMLLDQDLVDAATTIQEMLALAPLPNPLVTQS